MKRILGPEELKLWLFNIKAPFNVVLAARLVGQLQPEQLDGLLPHLALGGSLLTAAIESAERPHFVMSSAARPLFETYAMTDDDHWRRVMEHELNRPLPLAEGPLLRITLLRGDDYADILLCANHAAADALALFHLLNDMLGIMNGGAKIPQRHPMPAFEEMIPDEAFSASDGAALRDLWWSRRFGQRLASVNWDELADQLPAVGQTRVMATTLAPETMRRLAAVCRSQNTTVHGALGAAVTKAMADHAEEIMCAHAVNLRDRITPPFGDALGLCLSRVLSHHRTVGNSDFWTLARDVRQQISAALRSGEAFDRTLDIIRALNSSHRQTVSSEANVTLTNPGRLNGPRSKGARQLQFVASAGTVKVDGPVLSTVTVGDQMTWLWTFAENWCRADEAEAISRRAVAFITEALAGTRD